jgi:phage-related minor tail protein
MATAIEIVRRAAGNDVATLERELEKADAEIEILQSALRDAEELLQAPLPRGTGNAARSRIESALERIRQGLERE